jgi:hypothetical protein
MGYCARRLAVLALGLGAQGCFTGHLLDAARRIERPVAVEEAALTADRLLLRYTALVTDDLGEPLARRECRAAIALADLRRSPPVDRFPIERLANGASLEGQRVALGGPVAVGPFLEVHPGGEWFVLHTVEDGDYPPFYSAALARTRTAAWAYPLLPLTVTFDAAADPVLLFFAPMVIVLGD